MFDSVEKFLIGIVVIVVFGLAFSFTYFVGDRIGAAEMTGSGIVVSRDHTGAHTTYAFIGKVMVPQYYPEKWELCIKRDTSNDSGCVEVSKKNYDLIPNGAQASIVYFVGNLSNDLHIKSAQFH